MRALHCSVCAVVVGVASVAACSSFEGNDQPSSADGGAPAVTDAGDGADAGADALAPGDADGAKDEHLYVFGGLKNTQGASVKEAYRAAIQADGSLGAWERVQSLDVARAGAALAVTLVDRVVLAGGLTGNLGAELLDARSETVVTAGIRATSAWSAAAPLPAPRMTAAGTLAGKRIFVSGGLHPDDTLHDDVVVSTFESGALAPWELAGTLPEPRAMHGAVALGSRLYVVGGAIPSDGGLAYAPTASAIMASIGTDGSLAGWTDAGTMPIAVRGLAVVSVGLRVFAIGGADEDSASRAEVSVGSQAEDNKLGWAPTTPLPVAAYAPCAAASGSTIYVVGGIPTNGADAQASVTIGRVASNGGVTWTPSTPLPQGRAAAGCAIR